MSAPSTSVGLTTDQLIYMQYLDPHSSNRRKIRRQFSQFQNQSVPDQQQPNQIQEHFSSTQTHSLPNQNSQAKVSDYQRMLSAIKKTIEKGNSSKLPKDTDFRLENPQSSLSMEKMGISSLYIEKENRWVAMNKDNQNSNGKSTSTIPDLVGKCRCLFSDYSRWKYFCDINTSLI